MPHPRLGPRPTPAQACGWLCGLLLSLCGIWVWPGWAAEQPYPEGSAPVERLQLDWFDTARARRIPVQLYVPRQDPGPLPLILFSHGLGGSRESYAYLGNAWARAGYVVVHVQHVGSDSAVWQGTTPPLQAMRHAITDLEVIRARPRDISFAIDQMERLQREPGILQGRLQLSRIGVAGHSFGAYTALAVAGQAFFGPRGQPTTFTDARVRAVIPMSAPVPLRRDRLAEAFAGVRMPGFHMTGTHDGSLVGETQPAERRLPFDHIHRADQYLLIFRGGDHMVFAGLSRRRGTGANDAVFHALIRQSTLAFWDAYLRESTHAQSWLATGGFTATLGPHGTFEVKRQAP